MRLLSAVVLLFLAGFGLSQPLRVAVAPVIVTAPCKFSGPDVERTHGILADAAATFLDKAFTASDIVLVNPTYVVAAIEDRKLDFAKKEARDPEKLQNLAKTLEADMVLIVLVDWTEQKNADPGANLANPNTAKSSSKVRARIWLYNVKERLFALSGDKDFFQGEAKGGYFGTVNPRDMSGDPTSKGIVIASEYKKRAQYLGRALVEALKLGLRGPLELKDPPSP